MGSSVAPKTFGGPTSFGASPTPPIATQTQPLATVTGTQTPAMSGYNMMQQAPITDTPAPADGSASPSLADMRAQMQALRGNGGRPMPFYG